MASRDPIPIVLPPGFEYRLREWRQPNTGDVHWQLERRKSSQYAEDESSLIRTPSDNLTGAYRTLRPSRDSLAGVPPASGRSGGYPSLAPRGRGAWLRK